MISTDSSYEVRSRAEMSSRRTSSAALRCSSLGKIDRRSSIPRLALVPCAVTRFRNSSRTSGVLSSPIRLSVSSACCARDPPTPPISSYAPLVRSPFSRSRFSQSREAANARRGRAPRSRLTSAIISSTRASSSNRYPQARAGCTNARRRALGLNVPKGVSSENTGLSDSCFWQWNRKSSRRDTRTCTSASRTSLPNKVAKAS
jgi:hypothetical protein